MNILFIVPWDQEYGGVASVVGNLAKISIHGGDLFPGGKRKKKYSRSLKRLLNAADRIVALSKKIYGR